MRRPRRVSRHLARQPFGTRRAARCPSLRTRQGPLPVPHDTSRHDLVPATPVCPAGAGSLPRLGGPSWPSVVRFRPARYHEVGVQVPLRCVDRVRCCVAARHWRSFSLLLSHAGLFVPATSPVATGVCGAPYHRVITLAPAIFLAKPLARLAARPLLRPVTTGSPPPGDRPRKAPSAASSRRIGSDGALRLTPPARRTPPRRGSSSRWREAPRCRAGRGSPPAGRSGRSRRPSTAPASR